MARLRRRWSAIRCFSDPPVHLWMQACGLCDVLALMTFRGCQFSEQGVAARDFGEHQRLVRTKPISCRAKLWLPALAKSQWKLDFLSGPWRYHGVIR